MVIIPPHKLWGAYEAYLEAFRTAAEASGKDVKFDRPIRSCFNQLSKEEAEFGRCLYLKDWPSRNLDANKRLDVVVHALETFRTGQEWLLTKSTVYLNYFLISNQRAKLVQALHYDFDPNARLKYPHPLFHVQLTLEIVRVPENELRSMGLDVELDIPQEPNECWLTTRIPTPEMTFPSVLYCLVADHLGGGIFKQFADSVHSMLKNRLPLPNFDPLMDSLRESPGHLKSSHWFAHSLQARRGT